MKTTEALLYGGLLYGAWWLWSKRDEAGARARQENVLMPKITPTGDAPVRPSDLPLSADEQSALTSGAAYLNKNGWLTYVGMSSTPGAQP